MIDVQKYISEKRSLIKKHGRVVTNLIYETINVHISKEVSSIYMDLGLFPYFGSINDNYADDIINSYIVSDKFGKWLEDNQDCKGDYHIVTSLGDYLVWHKTCGNILIEDPSVIEYAKSRI